MKFLVLGATNAMRVIADVLRQLNIMIAARRVVVVGSALPVICSATFCATVSA